MKVRKNQKSNSSVQISSLGLDTLAHYLGGTEGSYECLQDAEVSMKAYLDKDLLRGSQLENPCVDRYYSLCLKYLSLLVFGLFLSGLPFAFSPSPSSSW